MEKKIDGVILMIWAYIIIALPPFLILYEINLSAPKSNSIPKFASSIPDLSTIIAALIILPIIGALISIFRKKMSALFFWQLNRQEKIHIFSISLLIAIIIWHFFSITDFLHYFELFILFIIFLLCLPTANLYLNSMRFSTLKQYIVSADNKSVSAVIENVLFLLMILLLIHTAVLSLDAQVRAYSHHQVLLSRYPRINSAQPKISYHATRMLIRGSGFGYKEQLPVELVSDQGPAETLVWTDEKIIFSVPLRWKTGTIKLWITKPVSWDGRAIILKSNVVELTVVSRFDPWDSQDDAYFQQLPYLDEETLRLNGHAF